VIGQTISHYRITEKLGEGGMGVVYKAEDTSLGRPVALKFLAPHVVSNSEVRKRFLREARAAAALNHPNICTVHEIGEANGRTFISMAYLEGGELAAEIVDGPIEVDRALQLATQFAEGLAEAHSKGIVHRDIKPANLFVTTNDRGVILDFGLAQLASADSELTREGTILGTCAYMSPEQSMGDDVDARTDVWAMGCVLYEMLAGKQPFRGHYEQAIIYSILNEDPEPLEDIPSGIEAVIRRCLAKKPQERYEDGRDLLKVLQGGRSVRRPAIAGTQATPSEVPRVAVLPLKARGGNAEMESFAEGLTEEITSGLSQFRHLVVVSSGAAAHIQETRDLRQVGKELDARFVLEGGIRKAGSSIRVSVQLLDAATGAHLWAERFDRDLGVTDIFAAQDELTDRIVATVADPFGVLTTSLSALVKAKPIDTLTAHECVLRWFSYFQQTRPEEHAEMRTAVEGALEREPNHADARACLSLLYLDEYRNDYNARPDPLDRALNAAQRAVELDTTSPLAYRALAEAHYFRRELGAFRPVADRVLSLNPRDTSNVAMISHLIAYGGDWSTGISVSRRVLALNPHHAGWLYFVFVFDHYRKREYEKALEAAEKLRLPGYPWASGILAAIHAQLGRAETARKHLKTFLDLVPDVASNARVEWWSKWFYSGEFVEHLVDGLRKAGLEIPGDPKPSHEEVSEVPRVAVLPFKAHAGDAELESFAEGLTQEITSGLSQFRHLVVVSAGAAAGFQGRAGVREVSREIGARFVLEGSIRKAGSSIRVSMQLLDASTGAHLWAERFDRDLSAPDIFAVQDELTDRIVATVADPFGVLTRSLGALAKAKPVDTLTAHDCVLRTFAYWQQVRPDEHAELRTVLEQALQREPNHAEALACLARLYVDEFRFHSNERPDALDRALRTAQQAVELDATSQLAYRSLAEAHYYRRELSAFRPAADRVLALNPRDTSNVAFIGNLIAFSGDWPTGRSVVEKVMQLNPHHAGWLHFVFVTDHYRRREFERALEAAEKINMPGDFWVSAYLAAIHAQLGRPEAARKHLETFVELAPDVARNPRAEWSRWFVSEEFVEHVVDGLRKAGLEIDGETPAAGPIATTAEAAPSEVPRVAVLPFKAHAGDAELESLAGGLTEEITSGLSQFRHLVVVSASAAASFQGPLGVREVGKQLDARFVLEGSIRKAGSSIRVSAQLLDAATGAHLWAERFDRDLGSADIFAAQDELTDRIVATVADPSGVLTRSLAALVKAKPIEKLTAHECVLRTFGYWQQVRPDEHADVRAALEHVVKREPNHAGALACLSMLYVDEFRHDFNARPDALDRALHTAQQAVELDATSQLAYRALAEAHYYRRDLSAFRPAADRTLLLNPRDTSNVGLIGTLIAFGGDWATGRSVVEKIMRLNPHHAGWLYFVFVMDHYRKGEYEQALEAAEKINMPGHPWVSAHLAAIHAQLGGTEAARKHLKTFLELAPDVAKNVRAEISKWHSEELVEDYVDGLRKAGLEIAGETPAPVAATAGAPAVPSDVPRVAVLPLKTRAGDAELESFAEGLTEEITSGLSQFRHLVVVSASAAASFQGPLGVREVGKQLDARFVLEGSIRKAGSSIRVSAQLLDAATGAHLWAERFDRDLGSADIFAAQDELTDRIVATVADPSGVLTRSLAALVKATPIDKLSAHECVLRTFSYWQQERPDEHAEVRTAIEQALQREPDHVEALACLSRLYLDEFRFDFNAQPDALDRALRAAQRAVELDATSQLAYRSLAEAHYFRRELGAFRPAADRVLSLNPRDTSNVAIIGHLIAYGGDWPSGCSVVQKVMQLNPHHAGWLHFVFVWDHYRKQEYEQALEAAEKVNMPGHLWESAALASINAQLGRFEVARKHLKTFVELAPDVARSGRAELSKWLFSEDLVAHVVDGLRKAGLEVEGDAVASEASPTAPSEVPRVAVLPLKTRAGDAELETFGEGLTEEVTAGLSQFRHLVVVSASAAARFKGPVDLAEVGRQLDARFLLEGSTRKTGSKIRVSVQLVDAATSAHLWVERFDRDLKTSDIFEAQDELTDRIVATIADPFGVLTRSLGTLVKAKPAAELTAYECVLWTFAYWQQVRPDEHAEVRAALEQALEREPGHAEAWACISRVYLDGFRFDFNVLPDALDRALQSAQRAVELDGTSQLAYLSLAEAHFFRKERRAFLLAADRVLALNPRDTSNVGMIGSLIAYAGEWERGCAVVRKVMQLNPHHAGWLNFVFVDDHYRKREYEQALEAAEKVNMPGHYVVYADLAAINAQLGRTEEARKHLKMFLELAPGAARNFRAELSKWFYADENVEHKMEGLRKAGLDVDALARG
jgi:TolB-like protein/cytochrome c-type biogenesis protein CcmH/NrfG